MKQTRRQYLLGISAFWLGYHPPARGQDQGLFIKNIDEMLTLELMKLHQGDASAADQQRLTLADLAGPAALQWALPAGAALQALKQWQGAGVSQIEAIGVPDRWGRQPAAVTLSDGTDLAEALRAAGLALSTTSAANGEQQAEQQAEQVGAGLWQSAPLDANQLPQWRRIPTGAFILAEGKIRAAAERGSQRFLNFGAQWRRDVTLSIRRSHWSLIEQWGESGAALVGRQCRLRGWLTWRFGPMLQLRHAGQLTLL